jgi:hypothetical protein
MNIAILVLAGIILAVVGAVITATERLSDSARFALAAGCFNESAAKFQRC